MMHQRDMFQKHLQLQFNKANPCLSQSQLHVMDSILTSQCLFAQHCGANNLLSFYQVALLLGLVDSLLAVECQHY